MISYDTDYLTTSGCNMRLTRSSGVKIFSRTTRRQHAYGLLVSGMSASVMEKVLTDIMSSLHLKDNVIVIAMLPDRPNKYLDVRRQRSYESTTY